MDGGGDQNMRGIFLHILADALGSVGVVVSSILIKYFGWHVADPLCSLMISVLILLSVVPLIQDTGRILLQQVPPNKTSAFASALLEIARMDSVQNISEPHFWSVRSGVHVGTLHVTVGKHTTSDRQHVLLTNIVHKLQQVGAKYTAVQIRRSGHSIEQQNDANDVYTMSRRRDVGGTVGNNVVVVETV